MFFNKDKMRVKRKILRRCKGIVKIYAFLRLAIIPIESIDGVVPKNGNIADYGCGFGITSCYLALSSKYRQVVGIEYSSKRVSNAIMLAKGIKNLKFKLGDISRIVIENANSHLMIDVLHHIDYGQQEKLLDRVTKKLRKGDLIIIKEIGKKPYLKYLWNFLHDKVMTLNDKLYFRDISWFENFLRKKDLHTRTLDCGNFFYPHFIVIAKR